MSNKKIFITVSIIFFVIISFFAIVLFFPNTKNKTLFVRIPTNSTLTQVTDSLQNMELLRSTFLFKVASKVLFYNDIRPGYYKVEPKENNLKLILRLRKGQHYPVTFTFNNLRTKEDFINKTAYRFLFTPEELRRLLNDESYLAKYGFTPQNVVAAFIPDTYEIYYDVTAEDFFEKLYGYYQKFWEGEREKKAKAIGLSPTEVVTLASIVEEENLKGGEEAIIAGLYINRLNKGMKLQADPTVKFAWGDFSLTRIYNKHLEIDSPYNTYLYNGLPPGPIRIPAPSTVDSVLDYTRHNYLFMCAKEDFSGKHNFAATDKEHAANARKYHQALNRRNR